LSLRKPSPEVVQRFLASQAKFTFTYSAVGATAKTPPAGFAVDHTRARLGEGQEVFRSASAALRRWEQFRLGWVEPGSPDVPLRPGEVVAIMGKAIGMWWLNACRIVYVVDDESGPVCRFGFAYGTLPGHAESGEERFLIEWNQSENSVWYDILAFSRPNRFLARLAYPVVRRLQKRFARDSATGMQQIVGLGAGARTDLP